MYGIDRRLSYSTPSSNPRDLNKLSEKFARERSERSFFPSTLPVGRRAFSTRLQTRT